MNRAQFKKQLQEGLNTVFGMEYKRYPEEWRAMFDVENSGKAYEEDVLMSGFGAAPVKAEGAGVAYDAGAEEWTARYTHETIALAFSITEEAEEDGLYGALGNKYSRALARSMVHTKEIKGANIFNNGFSSSFTGGDGVELFSTAHPLANGSSLANELTTPADISETALEDAIIAIHKFTDERGIPVAAQSRKVCVPTDLEFNIHRILYSVLRPGTADNDPNAMRAMGMFPDGVAVNHRLTDTDAWFIKTDCPDGLKHMVRKRIKRKVEGDFETGNMRYRARERYVFGWTDPRGAFGSAGAA
jgi:hypothetical protein